MDMNLVIAFLAVGCICLIAGVWIGVALHSRWLNHAIDSRVLETGNGEIYGLTKRRRRR